MSEYERLVIEMKSLTRTEMGQEISLQMAEDEWYTRPDAISYGTIRMDFESGQMNADGIKTDRAVEGSVDLFSMVRSGAGWVQEITAELTRRCGSSWELNSHSYERETGLFHWEWVFELPDAEAPEEEDEWPSP